MAEHLTEEQQVEALKQWWKDNGMSVAIGLVIGFAALFGWNYWNDYRDSQGETASIIYQQLLADLQSGNADAVQKQADTLRGDYTRTPYATLAAFAQAKIAVEKNDLDSAAAHLQWAMANTRQDQLEHTARIRLARVLLAGGKPDEVEKLIGSVKPGTYAAAYDEIKGDTAVTRGDLDMARDAYQRAISSGGDDPQFVNAIKLKLDDIAASQSSAPQVPAEDK